MANNRIYLRCMGCGDVLYLGKTYDMGYWWERYDGIHLEEKLNKLRAKARWLQKVIETMQEVAK